MSAASPKDDDNNSKTSPGRRASVGGPPGRRRSLAPEECLSVPSLPSSPASSLPRAMAGQASKPSTEERFPLVAKGTFQDLETGEGALDAPDGGPPATPHNLSWGGWRRNSNSCSNSSTERQQQGNTSASQPPLNPQAPTPMTGSSSSPGSRSPSDERFRRWWRFFGLEPLAVRAAVAVAAAAVLFVWRGWRCMLWGFLLLTLVLLCVAAPSSRVEKDGGVS